MERQYKREKRYVRYKPYASKYARQTNKQTKEKQETKLVKLPNRAVHNGDSYQTVEQYDNISMADDEERERRKKRDTIQINKFQPERRNSNLKERTIHRQWKDNKCSRKDDQCEDGSNEMNINNVDTHRHVHRSRRKNDRERFKRERFSGQSRVRRGNQQNWSRSKTKYRPRNADNRRQSSLINDLIQCKTTDSCEITMLLVSNEDQFRKFIRTSQKDIKRNIALLQVLEKAFISGLVPAHLNTLINVIEESDLIAASILNLEGYKHFNCTSFLDAVSSLLQIIIRICSLKPSGVTFIEGSFQMMKKLIQTIIESSNNAVDSSYKETQSNFLRATENTQNKYVVEENDNFTQKLEDKIGTFSLSPADDPSFKKVLQLFDELSAKRMDHINKNNRVSEEVAADITDPSINDFRNMSVIPNIEDLQNDQNSRLRPIKAKGPYKSVDDYLDVHFRLLREDFVQPLREGIRTYVGLSSRSEKKKIQDIKIYENVQIESLDYGEGLSFVLKFDISKFKNIRWNMSKRLKYGSLICLTPDGFKTFYFATIANSDARMLRMGRVYVKFSVGWETVKSLFGLKFTMIESTAYFEAYRPVLLCLQNVFEWTFPFKRYIIDCKKQMAVPRYLRVKPFSFFFYSLYDLRCLFCFKTERTPSHIEQQSVWSHRSSKKDLIPYEHVDILEESWKTKDLPFDESQLNALKSALTRELTIIQGPPGCGKTYVGLQIANALLHNRRLFCSQILVICYTNHALDQFLEGIKRNYDGDILRVGSRSKSKTLEENLISEKRKFYRKQKLFPKFVHQGRSRACKVFFALRESLNLKNKKVEILRQNIVSEKYLQKDMGVLYDQFTWCCNSKPPWLRFLGTSVMVDWLEITEKAIQIQNEIHSESQNSNIDDEADDYFQTNDRENFDEIEMEFCTKLKDNDLDALENFRYESLALDLQKMQRNLSDLKEGKRLKVTKERKRIERWIIQMLSEASTYPAAKIENIDIFKMKLEEKWALYWSWVNTACGKLMNHNETEKYEHAYFKYKEAKLLEDRHMFQKAHVVGMTTTGAANYRSILSDIRPAIVIVEEAAEVLESHIVTTLTAGSQHLVLIGDHKQLKPKPNVYKLETDYNLDISLFERMIRNGLPYNCLQVQHRMRPSIADNIRHIYDSLHDHDSVKKYEHVLGMKSDIFFWNHTVEERKDDELKSFTNHHEVALLLGLCDYLLMQGYDSTCITILTTYKGQQFLLRKTVLRDHNDLKSVRITTVDDYQGEENDIILLSLVRSNNDGRIGFLAKENRVCVALSRAKKGLFVVGNFKNLAKGSQIWAKIIQEMKSKDLYGDTMKLCCQNHPNDEAIVIEHQGDFKKASKGGCSKSCDIRLECGHACGNVCHTKNKEHRNFECKKQCNRTCSNGHLCHKLCFQRCKCEIYIEVPLTTCRHSLIMKCFESDDFEELTFECQEQCKITLKCGHVCSRKCYESCICMVPVKKTLPVCRHEVEMPCSINPERFQCPEACLKKLTCGHLCSRRCSERCGACIVRFSICFIECGHEYEAVCGEDLSDAKCVQICRRQMDCGHPCTNICGGEKTYDNDDAISKCSSGHLSICKADCETTLKCGHSCKGYCYKCSQGRWHEICSEPSICNLVCGHVSRCICGECRCCNEPCTRRCTHRICDRKCKDICWPCIQQCRWKCEHKKCTKRCGELCDRDRCNEPCKKQLSCGHACIGMCGDPCLIPCRQCDPLGFQAKVDGKEIDPDSRYVQLRDCGHIIRCDIMDQYMDIEEGPIAKRCLLCRKPITFTRGNRYEKVLNKININIDTLKQEMSRFKRHLFGEKLKIFLLNVSHIGRLPMKSFNLPDIIKRGTNSQETEREIGRYFDYIVLTKLRDRLTEASDMSEEQRLEIQEAFSVVKGKHAYTEHHRSILKSYVEKLQNSPSAGSLISFSIRTQEEQNLFKISLCATKIPRENAMEGTNNKEKARHVLEDSSKQHPNFATTDQLNVSQINLLLENYIPPGVTETGNNISPGVTGTETNIPPGITETENNIPLCATESENNILLGIAETENNIPLCVKETEEGLSISLSCFIEKPHIYYRESTFQFPSLEEMNTRTGNGRKTKRQSEQSVDDELLKTAKRPRLQGHTSEREQSTKKRNVEPYGNDYHGKKSKVRKEGGNTTSKHEENAEHPIFERDIRVCKIISSESTKKGILGHAPKNSQTQADHEMGRSISYLRETPPTRKSKQDDKDRVFSHGELDKNVSHTSVTYLKTSVNKTGYRDARTAVDLRSKLKHKNADSLRDRKKNGDHTEIQTSDLRNKISAQVNDMPREWDKCKTAEEGNLSDFRIHVAKDHRTKLTPSKYSVQNDITLFEGFGIGFTNPGRNDGKTRKTKPCEKQKSDATLISSNNTHADRHKEDLRTLITQLKQKKQCCEDNRSRHNNGQNNDDHTNDNNECSGILDEAGGFRRNCGSESRSYVSIDSHGNGGIREEERDDDIIRDNEDLWTIVDEV